MTSGRPRSRARTSNAERLASEQARRRPGRLWDTRPRSEPRPGSAAPKRLATSSPSRTHDDKPDRATALPDASPASHAGAEMPRRKPPAASRGTPSPSHWTAEEDRQLFHYRDQCDLEWDDIGKRVGGRSGPACRQRYYRLADAAVVSSGYGRPQPRWTPEQDRRSIPAYIPSRIAPVQPPPLPPPPPPSLQPSTAVARRETMAAPGPPPPDARPVPARPVEPGFADSYAAVTLSQGVFRLPPIL